MLSNIYKESGDSVNFGNYDIIYWCRNDNDAAQLLKELASQGIFWFGGEPVNELNREHYGYNTLYCVKGKHLFYGNRRRSVYRDYVVYKPKLSIYSLLIERKRGEL